MGRAKFGLTFQDTGKLTLTAFNKLYGHYKNDFDLEMRLTAANTTYAEAHKKAQKDDDWHCFFLLDFVFFIFLLYLCEFYLSTFIVQHHFCGISAGSVALC